MEKLVGFDARLKERGGKEKVGEGSFVCLFSYFFLDREK